MRLGPTLTLFALLLALSTGIAYLGYGYLQLASEYRNRNMIHLSATQEAIDIATRQRMPGPVEVLEIMKNIQYAKDQAHWCLDTLSAFERWAFTQLGAGRALDICEQDIIHSNQALEQANRLLLPEIKHDVFTQSAIATSKDLLSSLQIMRRDSHHFQPHVQIVQTKISQIVTSGTAVASAALALVFALVSRQLVRAWRLQTEQTLELDRVSRRFSGAIAAASEGFAILDENNCLVTFNEQFSRLYVGDADFLRVGDPLEVLVENAVHGGQFDLEGQSPDDFVKAYIAQMEAENYTFERRLELVDGRHVIFRVKPTGYGDKVFTRIEITDLVRSEQEQRDIADALQRAKDKLEQQALTDPLTGLPNRRSLDRALQIRLAQGPVTLIRIDLDRFKQVNDILGHEAGDFVLCQVAAILRDNCQGQDIPARVGGDEFVILCDPRTDLGKAENLAARLLENVLKPLMFQNKRCIYGASFGIAQGAQGTAASDLLSNADAALYKAKEAGRGTVEVFTTEMHRIALRDRALADRLAFAIETGEIQPFLQTQHFADSWDLSGIEILARWVHPQEGVLSPGIFLPIAQQMGMEADIDRAIFEQAVVQSEGLFGAGFDLGRVAFNVSAGRILDPRFVETIARTVPQGRDRYAFEILESISYEDNSEALKYVIDAVRDLGFKIDVDDFGSGHASINGVLEIEPDVIKIDRNIIFPLGQSERAARMVASVLDLAHSMEAKVVAEGVDSTQKAEILKQMGCDILQGYFFSKPMTFVDFERYLRSAGGTGLVEERQSDLLVVR